MADPKFTIEDLVADDRDERFVSEIQKNTGGKTRTTNAVNGRPFKLNLVDTGDLMQGLHNREDSAKTLAKRETLATTSFATLWGEAKGTGVAGTFEPEYGALIDHLYRQTGSPGSALTGGGGAAAPASPDTGASSNGRVSKQGWTWPTKTQTVTSEMGPRQSPGGVGSTNHEGIDISVPVGDPIYAAKDGKVEYAKAQGARSIDSYGYEITIHHGNQVYTRYAHLSEVLVSKGDDVTAGQKIAKSGGGGGPGSGTSTGPHLHFEIRKGGEYTDPPLNPRDYLPKD